MMRRGTPVALAYVMLAAAACSTASADRSQGASGTAASHRSAVLYTIGASTDPYGNSSPSGFGVVTGFGSPDETKREVRSGSLGHFAGAEWIGKRRILVPRNAPPFRPPLILRLVGGKPVREGPSPLPALDTQQEWSPDGRLVASKRIEPCAPNQRPRWKCYRQ